MFIHLKITFIQNETGELTNGSQIEQASPDRALTAQIIHLI